MNTDDVRERLADALHDANEWQYDQCDHGTYRGGSSNGQPYAMCQIVADALLPTVDALIREGAAKALDELATEMDGAVRLCSIPLWETAAKVRARAAALRAVSHTEATR